MESLKPARLVFVPPHSGPQRGLAPLDLAVGRRLRQQLDSHMLLCAAAAAAADVSYGRVIAGRRFPVI
jgi:hypothetical protein